MKSLAPSILSADFGNLNHDISKTIKAGSTHIHFDVMDGHFVPNISVGALVLKSIIDKHDALFDIHLMLTHPSDYLDDFIALKPHIITVHFESEGDTLEQLKRIRNASIKAGVSIKPKTKVSEILPLLEHLDLVLVMSVEPGFGGQGFIESSLEKISCLKEEISNRNLPVLIEVDGGVNLSNIESISNAGADILVAGSAVFSGDIELNTKQLLHKLKGELL